MVVELHTPEWTVFDRGCLCSECRMGGGKETGDRSIGTSDIQDNPGGRVDKEVN